MLPADPVTWKRKSVRRFGLTEAEVRRKLRKLVVIIEDEGATSIPVERLTFADLAKEYEENELIPAEYIGGEGCRQARPASAEGLAEISNGAFREEAAEPDHLR